MSSAVDGLLGRVESATTAAELLHMRLVDAGRIQGSFYDDLWLYEGSTIGFTWSRERSQTKRSNRPLSGIVGSLARCFVLSSISRGLSREGVRSRLEGMKCLAAIVGDDPASWAGLGRSDLNRAVALLARRAAPATAYNRAGAISKFVEFLNGTSRGAFHEPIIGRHIAWRHRLPNPIRSMLEITSEEHRYHSERKHVPTLHKGLGEARARLVRNPSLEPSPGYDRIRLEALAFSMSLGIRIGELCMLKVGCVGFDDRSSTRFVRVATEKGALPAARPLPKIWESAVCDAYDYLLERCAAARARAREIEERGFSFVETLLNDQRKRKPISRNFAAQLASLGLDKQTYFTVRELTDCLGCSEKEFWEGKFAESVVSLPKIVAAKIVLWLDERFQNWDWVSFSKQGADARTGQAGDRTLPANRVGRFAGVSKSTLPKAEWFYDDLRKLLVELSRDRVFVQSRIHKRTVEKYRIAWSRLRAKALGPRGGAQCVAVKIDSFKRLLSERYLKNMNRPFKGAVKSVSPEGVSWNNGVKGSPSRLSECLLVVWEHQFSGLSTLGLLPRPVHPSDFYNYLCHNAQKKTIFQRLNLRDENGKWFSFSSHSIRHWVTTAILRSGPSEMMVDLWMGRSHQQSRHYDHRTASERAEAIRCRYLASDPPHDFLGRKVRFWREENVDEASIKEMVESKLRVMHFVPWGACSRELYVSPCDRGLMCLRGFGTERGCPSFHVDPRDAVAREAVRALKEKYEAMLRAIDPLTTDIDSILRMELNDSEPLDQHLSFIKEVVVGCKQALFAYGHTDSIENSAGHGRKK